MPGKPRVFRGSFYGEGTAGGGGGWGENSFPLCLKLVTHIYVVSENIFVSENISYSDRVPLNTLKSAFFW